MRTFPGGAWDNKRYFGPRVHFADGISDENQMLLFDPQTSGGLLLAVPASRKELFLERAREVDLAAWVIGEAVTGEGISVI